MRQIILVIFFTLFLSNCKKVSVSASEMDPIELKSDILENGNTESYILFTIYQYGKKIDKDFLSVSLKMYHKYLYDKALSEIYKGFIFKNYPDLPFLTNNLSELFVKISKKDQEKGLNYLKIGVEKGDYTCIKYLIEYYDYVGEISKSKDLLFYENELVKKDYKKVNDSINKSRQMVNDIE